MCGIVGFFKTKTNEHQAVNSKLRSYMEDAMYIDALRGFHSVGLMTGHRGVKTTDPWSATWVKMAAPVSQFVKNETYDRNMSKLYDLAWGVAHNRWATVGAVNNNNAHPFHHGDIMLVQNGTVSQAYNLPEVEGYPEVDTKALTESFAKNAKGFVDTLRHVEGVDGAYALVWHDARDGSLNFIRNSKRPFFFVECAGITFFGSELFMVLAAASRNGYKHKKFTELPEHTHVKVVYDEKKLDYTCKVSVSKLDIQPIKPVRQSYYGGSGRRVWNDFDEDDLFSYGNGGGTTVIRTGGNASDNLYVSKQTYLRGLLIEAVGAAEFDIMDQYATQQKKTLREAFDDWAEDAKYGACSIQADAVFRAASSIPAGEIHRREEAFKADKEKVKNTADAAFKRIRCPYVNYNALVSAMPDPAKRQEYSVLFDKNGMRVWVAEDFPDLAALRVAFARGLLETDEYRPIYAAIEAKTLADKAAKEKKDNISKINQNLSQHKKINNEQAALQVGNHICFVPDNFVRKPGQVGTLYAVDVSGRMITDGTQGIEIVGSSSELTAATAIRERKMLTGVISGRVTIPDPKDVNGLIISKIYLMNVVQSNILAPASFAVNV